MPISHDDIEPELTNAQEAFRRGGQTPEEGLDVSSADLVQLRKACRLLSGAERLLEDGYYTLTIEAAFTSIERTLLFWLITEGHHDPSQPPQSHTTAINRSAEVGFLTDEVATELEEFGVQRSRKAVHDWVHKADLQLADDASPDHVALDETVIRINGQQYWLYAAVDPDTNRILHCQLFSTTTTALTERFLRELKQKHTVEDAVFLVDYAKHLKAALRRAGLRFQPMRHGNRNSVERVFIEVKRRTSSFSNSFSHVDPTTAESWLQAYAVWWNSLN